MATQSISIIGAGNLAWHLAPALDNMGYVVKEVYSRNPRNAKDLTARLYQAEVKATLDFSTSPSQIFIIATSDDSIQSIAQEIILPDDAILAHTSGSQPLSVLGYAATSHIGVFYPLQTFTKSKRIDFSNTPIFIESETTETERALMKMARSISQNVQRIGSTERKALHIAAVFASNFTNHMLTLSKDLMKRNSLDFDVLKPLITETLNKSLTIGPENAQTGPARRGDFEILDKHYEFLQENQSVAAIYKLISQDIIDRYEVE